MSPRRSSSWNDSQPGAIGNQYVSNRYVSTEATAVPGSSPAAVRPATSAASNAPSPPGVGATAAIAEAPR